MTDVDDWPEMSAFPDVDPDVVLTPEQNQLVRAVLTTPTHDLDEAVWKRMLEVTWGTDVADSDIDGGDGYNDHRADGLDGDPAPTHTSVLDDDPDVWQGHGRSDAFDHNVAAHDDGSAAGHEPGHDDGWWG